MVHRVQVRSISNEEGNRLLRIVRRSSGSVVTWRRAQMVLLSAQGMDATRIAEVTFTSADRVRDVIHNFDADGFDALYPRYGPFSAGRRGHGVDPDEHAHQVRHRHAGAVALPALSTCRSAVDHGGGGIVHRCHRRRREAEAAGKSNIVAPSGVNFGTRP